MQDQQDKLVGGNSKDYQRIMCGLLALLSDGNLKLHCATIQASQRDGRFFLEGRAIDGNGDAYAMAFEIDPLEPKNRHGICSSDIPIEVLANEDWRKSN